MGELKEFENNQQDSTIGAFVADASDGKDKELVLVIESGTVSNIARFSYDQALRLFHGLIPMWLELSSPPPDWTTESKTGLFGVYKKETRFNFINKLFKKS